MAGRKRCDTQMGFAHRVLPEVPTDRIARPQSSSPWWSVCFADKEPGLQKADQTQGSNGGSAIQRGSASGSPHCRDQESKTASFSSGTPMGHMALVDVLRLGALSQRPHTVPGQAGQRSAALGRDTHYESSHIVFPISTVPPPASAPVSHTEAHSTLNGTVAPGANPFRQPYARTLVPSQKHPDKNCMYTRALGTVTHKHTFTAFITFTRALSHDHKCFPENVYNAQYTAAHRLVNTGHEETEMLNRCIGRRIAPQPTALTPAQSSIEDSTSMRSMRRRGRLLRHISALPRWSIRVQPAVHLVHLC